MKEKSGRKRKEKKEREGQERETGQVCKENTGK